METVKDFLFLGSKITVTAAMKLKDLGTKVVTNLDSVLKSRDVSLPKELDHKEG